MNETNVFVVDWGKLASLPCYPAAAINTKFAAKCAADLLMKLEKLYASTFRADDIHGIGFSLGAHFVSFVSNRMFKTNGKKLQRITGKKENHKLGQSSMSCCMHDLNVLGLDPALPFFATNSPSKKLDATDAHFVDVIHTNAGYFGKIEASGHVDFYMNGGQTQPACYDHQSKYLVMSAKYFVAEKRLNADNLRKSIYNFAIQVGVRFKIEICKLHF